MAELLGIPVLVHPRGCGAVDRPDPAREFVQALSDLAAGGVLDRFPALTVCVTPAGGTVPSSAQRRWPIAGGCRLYIDTLVGDDASLAHLVSRIGADRVLLGSGYPYGATPTREQRAELDGGAAMSLFRLNRRA
jgi:aminocarboxymuconate-semialdehyde decarboxylase